MTNTFLKPVALGSISAFMFLGLAQATIANAQTYLYVTSAGSLSSIEADTADMAIMNAPDIAANSGVIEMDNFAALGGSEVDDSTSDKANANDDDTYAYVDEDGDIEYVDADSDAEALDESEDDAAYNSGVLDTEEFDDSEELE